MARPRKATAVLQMSGAFAKNPSRAADRANEPEPNGKLGSAPDYLTDAEKKVWREMKRTATWLTAADQFALEAVCLLTAKMRAGNMQPSEFSVLKSLLSACGLTPADRSRVHVAPPAKKSEPEDDEWAAILRKPRNIAGPTN